MTLTTVIDDTKDDTKKVRIGMIDDTNDTSF